MSIQLVVEMSIEYIVTLRIQYNELSIGRDIEHSVDCDSECK